MLFRLLNKNFFGEKKYKKSNLDDKYYFCFQITITLHYLYIVAIKKSPLKYR